ncbi:hypothetical protein [Halomonas sp. E19]|uniref:hypothetical protein n=1 Tax=Halomonas sp. E19 TaxID=3397247 RepID=UPI0040345BC1
MEPHQDDFIRVTSPGEIEALLDQLIQPGGASLLLDAPESAPLPVVVMEQQPGESLTVDLSAIREVVGELKRGLGFRLLGQFQGKMIRTPSLKAMSLDAEQGRTIGYCEYPFTWKSCSAVKPTAHACAWAWRSAPSCVAQ